MYVITADQKDSRSDVDRAGVVLADLNRDYTAALELPVDRTSGDEIQALLTSPADALAMVLDLTRLEHWSVGLGIGEVRTPLPAATREATGAAFIAARDAVDAAKRSPTRFALAVATAPDRAGGRAAGSRSGDSGPGGDSRPGDPEPGAAVTAAEVEALITLLLIARDRRTPQGWEVADLLATVDSQKHVATALGVSPQAVSTRVRTSGWRTEQAALPGLVKLLASLDTAPSSDAPRGAP